MSVLRAECPWDRVQTHASLRRHLLEETYETLDALDRIAAAGGSPDAAADLQEELGDLVFQVVFHAHLAAEEQRFDLCDVVDGVRTKLVGRHPAIFGDGVGEDGDELDWERAKVQEKGRRSVMDGIPPALPAVAYAAKVVAKADAVAPGLVGTYLDAPPGGEGPGDGSPETGAVADEAELGRRLLRVVAAARRAGLDPEAALRTAAGGLEDAVRSAEAADPGVP